MITILIHQLEHILQFLVKVKVVSLLIQITKFKLVLAKMVMDQMDAPQAKRLSMPLHRSGEVAQSRKAMILYSAGVLLRCGALMLDQQKVSAKT